MRLSSACGFSGPLGSGGISAFSVWLFCGFRRSGIRSSTVVSKATSAIAIRMACRSPYIFIVASIIGTYTPIVPATICYHGIAPVGVVVPIVRNTAIPIMHLASGTIKVATAILVILSVFIENHVVMVTIANGTVISSVGIVINNDVGIKGAGIIHMPRPVNIIRVEHVYRTRAVHEMSVIVIDYMKTSHSHEPSVVIADVNIARPDYPSEFIVVHRHIFHLYHGSVGIVLHIGIIVVTRVEGYVHIGRADGNGISFLRPDIDKIKLAIGKNGKFNIALNEDKSVAIITSSAGICLFHGRGSSGKSC